jgi:hypothetical protein
MAELLRHRQTKEAATDMLTLQPPRHIPTLPFSTGPSQQELRLCPLYPEKTEASSELKAP